MSFTLRVFLRDLIALVFEGDNLWALLPDAVDDGEGLDPHFPVAVFYTPGVTNGEDWMNPIVREELNLFGDRENSTLWRLDREEIFLSPVDVKKVERANRGASGALPARRTANDYYWIPKMREVYGPAASIDPGCLSATGVSAKIIGRMKFASGEINGRGGEIGTFAFVKKNPEDLVLLGADTKRGDADDVWIHPLEFKDRDGREVTRGARALADIMYVDIKIKAECVTVTAKKFEGDDGDDNPDYKIELRPDGSGMAFMMLANIAPYEAIIEEPVWGDHFLYYYDLSAGGPFDEHPIPFRVEVDHPVRAADVEDAHALIFNLDENPFGGYRRQICTFVEFDLDARARETT